MINIVLRKMKGAIKLAIFKRNWRKRNIQNYTTVKNIFPIEKVIVGKNTYGSLNINTYGNPKEKLIIGSYCSIAGDVTFLLGGEHSYKNLSTYPFKKYIYGIEEETLSKGPIVIKDDVWIGQRSLILSGVTIGQGAVIAAGSIVSKDIPPYAIYAEGKIIKYRFTEDIIERLLDFNYEKLDEETIRRNINLLYSELDLDKLKRAFDNNSHY